jgi:hypothetical protein
MPSSPATFYPILSLYRPCKRLLNAQIMLPSDTQVFRAEYPTLDKQDIKIITKRYTLLLGPLPCIHSINLRQISAVFVCDSNSSKTFQAEISHSMHFASVEAPKRIKVSGKMRYVWAATASLGLRYNHIRVEVNLPPRDDRLI